MLRSSVLAAVLTLVLASPAQALAPYVLGGNPASPRAMICVHGGGWLSTGPNTVNGIQPWCDRYASRGWRTFNTDYTPGGPQGLRDVMALYDFVSKTRPGRVCLMGQSAGAQLALMVAASSRQPLCVIAQAAPMDLTHPSANLAPAVKLSFPSGTEAANSPLLQGLTAYQNTRIQIAQCVDDSYVPIAQADSFASRYHVSSVRFGTTGTRDQWFVHCATTIQGMAFYDAAEDVLLDGVGG
jgi:acetyl esterase/lipase